MQARDGRTDRRTDRQSATQYAAPSYGGGPHKKEVQHASRMQLHWLHVRRWNNHASLLCVTTAAGAASPNSIYGKRRREWTPN